MHLALRQMPTGKILFIVGQGGDGKGMHGLLDQSALGPSNVGHIDFNIFSDRSEFRRSV